VAARSAPTISWLALALLVLTVAGCGGKGMQSAKSLRACIDGRLAPGAVAGVRESTADGVTTLDYLQGGGETLVSVFPSQGAAKEALAAEARIGDAHDERIRNVLYGGGGSLAAAVEACVR
jgi:hypothetical protein